MKEVIKEYKCKKCGAKVKYTQKLCDRCFVERNIEEFGFL